MSLSSRRPLYDEAAEDDGFRRTVRAAETDLDITPMIDVTFLLLIFFMVTSTMQGTPDVDVPPARHGVGVNAAEAMVIRIRAPAAFGARPVILFEDDREGTLPEVGQAADAARKAGRSQVIIRADREVPSGFVQNVIEQVNTVEGLQFFIEVRDKQ